MLNSLTKREVEVLQLLEVGLSNKDIAAKLYTSPWTVKNQVHAILTKLRVDSRYKAGAVYRTFLLNGGQNAH